MSNVMGSLLEGMYYDNLCIHVSMYFIWWNPWLQTVVKNIYTKNRQYRIQPRITQESIKTLIYTVVLLLRERFKLEIIIKIIYINKCVQILTA